MRMAGSMAIYSSSPPAIWSNQAASTPSCFDMDAHSRPQSGQQLGSNAIIGGLSSLFSNPHARASSDATGNSLDSATHSNIPPKIIKSRSQNDLCTAREATDSWLGGVNIPSSAGKKVKECSPVSVFQGPSSHCSNTGSYKLSTARDSSGSCGTSLLDGHLGISRRRHSFSMESKRTPHRYEGFQIRRAESWNGLNSAALGTCVEYEKPAEFSDDGGEISESFSFESGPEQPGSSPVGTSNLPFSSLKNSSTEREEGLALALDREVKAWVNFTQHEPVSSSVVDSMDPCPSQCSHPSALEFRRCEEILKGAQSRHEFFKDPFVVRAFRAAERAHRDQFRATGDPYLIHCAETALLLAEAGASKIVVAAGLLHDTLDDTSWDKAQLRESFGDDVANMVEGVSRLSKLSQLARDNNTANKTVEADRLRTMFLAMVDVRVVLVKLADRLHNLRTLGALSEAKQQRIASETLEIFAPLASRLGIWSWKAEMEDLCFRFQKPLDYHNLVQQLAKGSSSRETTLMLAIQLLDKALREAHVPFHDLCGRSKSLYSIHSKMLRKGRCVDEIYDVRGLRLIVTDESGCYSALEMIHQIWSHIPGKLKDYIKRPKYNGYQSLHTVVVADDGLPLEVQIRTMEMHHQAEFGVAAHWRYKEGNSKHSSFILQRVEWARWVLTWQSEMTDTKLRLSPLNIDLRPPCPFPFHVEGCPYAVLQACPPENEDDPLFVIMLEDDKMMVQEFPLGSTVADLVRRMQMFAWKEIRLRINHQIVQDLQQKLHMGDLIEFTTFMATKSLDECREEIRRMYGDNACMGGSKKKKSPSYHDHNVVVAAASVF